LLHIPRMGVGGGCSYAGWYGSSARGLIGNAYAEETAHFGFS